MYLSPPRIHAWAPSQAIMESRDEFIAFQWITIAFPFEQTETNRWCKWYESNALCMKDGDDKMTTTLSIKVIRNATTYIGSKKTQAPWLRGLVG